jgi:hypothetical protein
VHRRWNSGGQPVCTDVALSAAPSPSAVVQLGWSLAVRGAMSFSGLNLGIGGPTRPRIEKPERRGVILPQIQGATPIKPEAESTHGAAPAAAQQSAVSQSATRLLIAQHTAHIAASQPTVTSPPQPAASEEPRRSSRPTITIKRPTPAAATPAPAAAPEAAPAPQPAVPEPAPAAQPAPASAPAAEPEQEILFINTATSIEPTPPPATAVTPPAPAATELISPVNNARTEHAAQLPQLDTNSGAPEQEAQILVITREDETGDDAAHHQHHADLRPMPPADLPAEPLSGRRKTLLSPSIFSAGNSTAILAGKTEEQLCGVCEKHVAEIHCIECQLNLCVAGDCNRTMHRPQKMRSHSRVPIVNNKPDFEMLRPGAAANRPGTSQNGRQSIVGTPTSAGLNPNDASPRLLPLQRSESFHHRSMGGRHSMAGQLNASVMGQLKDTAATAVTPVESTPKKARIKAEGGESSSDSEDETDQIALAKEQAAAAVQGNACDQCHLEQAVVYCIDCASSLCDGASSSCNKRIHKARSMARHRQVKVEERDELVAQMEAAEAEEAGGDGQGGAMPMTPSSNSSSSSSAAASAAAAASNHLSPSHHLPRASFIAPLSSSGGRSMLVSQLTPKRPGSSSNGGGGGGGAFTMGNLAAPSPSMSGRSPSPSSGGSGFYSPSEGGRSRGNSLLTPTHGAAAASPGGGRPPLSPTTAGASGPLIPRPPTHSRPGSSAGGQFGSPLARPLPTPTMDGDEFDPSFTDASPSNRPSSIGTSFRPSPPSTAATDVSPRPFRSGSSSPGGTSSRPQTNDTERQPPNSASIRSTDLEQEDGSRPTSAAVIPSAVMAATQAIDKMCDNCDDHLAAVYCVECKMMLCLDGQCHQLIHRPTRLKSHTTVLMAIPA